MITTESLVIWIVSSLLLYITALIVPGFKIESFIRAMLAALIVGLLNILLKPLLLFLSLPINILTFGLFTFVINAVILKLAAAMIKGFDIKGWWPAILASILMVLLQIAVSTVMGQ